jgi:quercetin dioxygenase-like cupin family protein
MRNLTEVGGTAMKNRTSMKNRSARRKAVQVLSLSLAGAAWVLAAMWVAGSASTPQDGMVTPLLSKDLAGVPGKELSMITVEYPPGGSSPAHTHHAQALVYVLEGSIVMQVKGKAPVTLTAGQTFYEGPDDVHLVSRNASHTARAKYVVFLVKSKGAPILTPLK